MKKLFVMFLLEYKLNNVVAIIYWPKKTNWIIISIMACTTQDGLLKLISIILCIFCGQFSLIVSFCCFFMFFFLLKRLDVLLWKRWSVVTSFCRWCKFVSEATKKEFHEGWTSSNWFHSICLNTSFIEGTIDIEQIH